MPAFKFLLPTMAQLTRSQREAVLKNEPVLVTGVPGSGKTVVSIHRLLINSNAELFTYTRMLKTSIAHSTMATNVTASRRINSVHAWYWAKTHSSLMDALDNDNVLGPLTSNHVRIGELIIDEAQDLPKRFYMAISNICDKVSLGADDAQQMYDVDTCEYDLRCIFSINVPIELGQNFRNKYEIFNFARQFMPDNPRSNDQNVLERLRMENSGGELPFVYENSNDSSRRNFINTILDNNRNKNIALLVYNQSTVDRYYELVKSLGYECSKYHSGLTNDEKLNVENSLKNILITTFHSSKGLEFDIVIMPEFETASLDKSKFYYVGSTRAKDNLFIICAKRPGILNSFNNLTYNIG